jgi:DNA-binding winged helix-turn-helix (wHTH) protein/Tol biopolymer transport system component
MEKKTKHFYEFGEFRLDLDESLLLHNGKLVYLKPKVLETLVVLLESRGRILTKEMLMQRLWQDAFVEEANLTVNISLLRKALGQAGGSEEFIKTVPRRGYRFTAEVREVRDEEPAVVVKEFTTSRITIEEQETIDEEMMAMTNLSAAASGGEIRANRLRRYWKSLGAAAAASLALAVIVTGLYWALGTAPAERFQTIKLTRLTNIGIVWRAAISPDGKYVAYVTREAEKQSLWVRQVATNGNVQIVAPAEVFYWGLTFSPDGHHIFFVRAESKNQPAIYQVAVLGGAIKRLIETVHAPFAVSPDGKQFAYVRESSKEQKADLTVANVDGSGERTLATRQAPNFFYTHQDGIAWSPDGRVIACHAGGTDDSGYYRHVVGVQVEDGTEKPITSKRWKWIGGLGWLADGSGLLLTASDHPAGWDVRQIWQIAYPDGAARRITNDLSGYLGMSLTADVKMMLTIQETTYSTMWIMPGAEVGHARPLTSGSSDGHEGVAWMPDGRIVYTSKASGHNDQHIWIMDADGSNGKPLTTSTGLHTAPAVTSDGRYIVFSSRGSDDLSSNIWRMEANDSNPKQLTYDDHDILPQPSPDGKWVVYTHRVTPAMPTLWKVPLEGGEPVQLHNEFTYGNAVSPDGQFIACGYRGQASNGHLKIALLPFTGGPPVKLFDLPLRLSPYVTIQWTPDGQAFTYSSASATKVWRQSLAGGPPKESFDFQSDFVWRFARSPDGKQLAVARGSLVSDAVLISNFK